MPAKLSTHVLDILQGRPAANMQIDLFTIDGAERKRLKAVRTNADGRTDEPLLQASEMKAGEYELVFHVGEYFGEAKFLDRVPVRFRISDPTQGYHVPLLTSPWAYSTYRGS